MTKSLYHITPQDFAKMAGSSLEFPWQIAKMNWMYELPIRNHLGWITGDNMPVKESLDSAETALNRFAHILQDELDEVYEVMAILRLTAEFSSKLDTTDNWRKIHEALLDHELKRVGDSSGVTATAINKMNQAAGDDALGATPLERFRRLATIMLADWLADMTIYLRNEALQFGIPLEDVLALVMASNFTKLGKDGKPIKDERGKVQKGPDFIPPEAAINELLFGEPEKHDEYHARFMIQDSRSYDFAEE